MRLISLPMEGTQLKRPNELKSQKIYSEKIRSLIETSPFLYIKKDVLSENSGVLIAFLS